jgi:amino-acid N-acetyltransferase
MDALTCGFANPADAGPLRSLLADAGLPFEDIGDHIPQVMVAKLGGRLVGCVGLEPLGEFAMLRSLTVAPASRGRGIGRSLYERIVAHARLHGVGQLYLLTTTAEEFFTQLGFSRTDRTEVPPAVQSTQEFRTLCPSTATCMVKSITQDALHYPQEVLRLQSDIPGARMWGVALERTMLTYFEVAPHSRFETHRHESEQITMVLQGELFFETGGKVVCVKEGEVIAIPSHVSHAAFTHDTPAKAVDAWSPVMSRERKAQ